MEGHKKTPNNAGVTYFKWVPQTRMLLLNTCLDKQVWTAGHGKGNCIRMSAPSSKPFRTTRKNLKHSLGVNAKLSLKVT